MGRSRDGRSIHRIFSPFPKRRSKSAPASPFRARDRHHVRRSAGALLPPGSACDLPELRRIVTSSSGAPRAIGPVSATFRTSGWRKAMNPHTTIRFWSGFSDDQWLCCSLFGANAHFSGQNLLTFHVIYHQFIRQLVNRPKVRTNQAR